MYYLSSYVLGGIVTALVLTPFVSGPDRSFVGTLLATTSAPEATVSVNRALKGDRLASNSLVAEHAAIPQTVIPKSTVSSRVNAPNAQSMVETARRPAIVSPATNAPLLDGCESAFSEITDRQLANIPGRCMAALPATSLQMAALN